MTQGNPFGRAPARWMTETKLRALANARLTYDEIALANERSEGWRPSRSAVKRKLESMGLPPRRGTHGDLMPWKVKTEHNRDRLRHMLGAESRARRGGKPLSDSDRKLVAQLHEMLFGRGKLMVVGYHEDIGFYLTDRKDTDEDIVRMPSKRFADPAEQAIWDDQMLSEAERYERIANLRSETVAASGKTG